MGIISVALVFFILWIFRAVTHWTQMEPLPKFLEVSMLVYFSTTSLVFNVVGKNATEAILSVLFWLLVAALFVLSISTAYSSFLSYLRIGGGVEANVLLTDGRREDGLSLMIKTNTEIVFWDASKDVFIYVPIGQVETIEIARLPHRSLPKAVRDF